MKIDKRFQDTEYVVEADSFAQQALWERYSTQASWENPTTNTINWESDSVGTCFQIGSIKDCPVVVSFFWAKLNGHLIMFYEGTSQVVDYKMIENWLDKYCNPQHQNQQARVNANNFHQVIHYVQES